MAVRRAETITTSRMDFLRLDGCVDTAQKTEPYPHRIKTAHIVAEKAEPAKARSDARAYIFRLRPPSTEIICPVINGASVSRNTMVRAISSGVPVRFRGVLARILL